MDISLKNHLPILLLVILLIILDITKYLCDVGFDHIVERWVFDHFPLPLGTHKVLR